ncbi:serine hydrolase domain-containing protein [Umezawaea sp. Da 62-37]|uniref:serine hydrolase domain-containing protein n=1 Tax=Umezawaea sp. Da 62-37 TaxID=3075927 RepID=UPI0028F70367|nr:serine hydrolase domain-containing protein [Umezawaea sp. Da 62-37]WNV90458.1 serine hydrolase domain-containing protein [Umezawaea sp. Da 62-37]
MKKARTARIATSATLVGAVLAVLVTAGTGSPAYAGQPGADRPASGVDRLQAAVEDLHRLGITGVQGYTRVGNRTTTARSGVADVDTGAPVPVNAYFRMGSNTKTFVAVILLQLVGEKRLSLEDAVDRWLPGVVSGNGNDGGRTTVRQLLQHTSGIAEYLDDVAAVRSAEEFRAHRYDHYEAEDLVALAMGHPPLFAPGTSWSYSNTNYALAGMIIEAVTGRSWADEVRARILVPLNLRQTYAPGDDPTVRSPHAAGYNRFVPDGPLVDTSEFNPTVADAAGALVSTPTDLARFWQALQGGQLLAPAQMAQMRRTVAAPDIAAVLPGARYGLGIVRVDDSCGVYWAHPGDTPGSSTVNGVSPDGERVVVLSLTTQSGNPVPVYQRAGRLVDEVLCS